MTGANVPTGFSGPGVEDLTKTSPILPAASNCSFLDIDIVINNSI